MSSHETFRGNVTTYTKDILSLVKDIKHDVLYLDPPYNTRQYGPNYHLYETFVRNDNPQLSGKTGLRNWKNESDSKFCSKPYCLNFLEEITKSSNASWFFMSYNSDGLLSKDDILKSLSSCGYCCVCHEQPNRRYKADTSDSRKYNDGELYEYLFSASRNQM